MMFDLKQYQSQIAEAADMIRGRIAETPTVGVICGTGMGALAAHVEDAEVIPYDSIPNFPVSTVESHHGNLAIGKLGGRTVALMQGRFHYYEGYSMREVTFPVRVMKALGCTHLIVMNAVGSMNPLIPSGSLVLAADHINLMGDNPLIGPNDEAMGPRFPDMSEPYDKAMRAIAREVALAAGIILHEGVMIAVTGPNLETAAEYRMFQRIGADIVTMSTVPEIIVAKHAGLRSIAISTVTDGCLPDALKEAKLEDIITVAQMAEPKLEKLVTGVLEQL